MRKGAEERKEKWENPSSKVAKTDDGSVSGYLHNVHVFHSRLSNQLVVQKMYEPTSQDLRRNLVERVIQHRPDTTLKADDR